MLPKKLFCKILTSKMVYFQQILQKRIFLAFIFGLY